MSKNHKRIGSSGGLWSRLRAARSAGRRRVSFAAAATVTVLAAGFGLAAPAFAAPESEIVTRWAEGTPAASRTGDVVTAEVRVNVNDDQAAPDNADVDNFTAEFTTSNGEFSELPSSCLTDGVDPASSISADGTTLICNFGTQVEGSALALQVPIDVTGSGGEQVTFDGSVGDVSAPQLTHDIVTEFMMDFKIDEPSAVRNFDGQTRELQFEWTLNLGNGSEAGPDEVTYRIEATPSAGVLTALDQCGPFEDQVPSGHPNSGTGSPAARTAPFVDSCTLTAVGPNAYELTLSGIDYSLAQVPTETSGGAPLPADRTAVASGKFRAVVSSADPGVLDLSVNTPTYTSTLGNTSVDDAENNTASKTWENPGLWVSSFNRGFTGAGGSPHDDTYRVSPGTLVRSSNYFAQAAQNLALTDDQMVGMCAILDTKYVDLSSISLLSAPGGGVPDGAVPSWYVGSAQAALDPDSAAYDPGSLASCGDLAGGSWVTDEPDDLTSVQAVRYMVPYGSMKQNVTTQMFVEQTVQADAPIGMDVWQFSSNFVPGRGWTPTVPPASGNAVPDARYPATNGFRDLLRVVGLTPAVDKSASQTVLAVGVPVTYTLDYSANGGAAAPDATDGYRIVDTLPAGLSFVDGSADPAPEVTTDGDHEVLTWNLDDVPTNTVNSLTYDAELNAQAEPGDLLTNTAVSSVDGRDSAETEATVTVANSGLTIIGKSADQALIPNTDGDGDGTGSWTVTLRSADPVTQSYTDVIDILPYNGDGRGTEFSGDYALSDVPVSAGGTVYYTTADPTSLSDDPAAASNGSAGDVSGNTVGWTTTKPDATAITAIRVIGGDLAPGATRSFQVVIQTQGAVGGDVFVNRAQARASHTELVMRTSDPTTVSQYYAYDLKKYVRDADGAWHDAQDTNDADWPTLAPGSTAQYKFVVTNTGQGDLSDIVVTDELLDADWSIDSLPAGESVESDVYSYALTADADNPLRNEACAQAPLPADSTQDELAQPCDEANVKVGGYTVSKTSDPQSGSQVDVGDVITYSVEVRQTGAATVAAGFADTLTDVLDDATYNGDIDASSGEAVVDGDALSWTGELGQGDIATITYSVTVTAAGDKTLRNAVLPTEPGGTCVPAPDENPDCKTTHRVEEPPVDNPPTDPPTDNPPTDNPPADNPPADNPPVDNPPAANPPVDNPPAANPPAAHPPVATSELPVTGIDASTLLPAALGGAGALLLGLAAGAVALWRRRRHSS